MYYYCYIIAIVVCLEVVYYSYLLCNSAIVKKLITVNFLVHYEENCPNTTFMLLYKLKKLFFWLTILIILLFV